MNAKKIIDAFCGTCCLLLAATTFAQNNNVTESGTLAKTIPQDGFYNRYLHTEKRVLEYDFIHEKDVFWEKRTWRVIDIKEKMNQVFKYEKKPFIMVMLDAAKAGDITLYHTFDDSFTQPMTDGDRESCISKVDTVCIFDPDTFVEECKEVINEFNPEDVKQFRLKEVYFFDEETSKMDVRILGIAPIIERYDDNGNFLNSGPMFWAYYPEMRESLARVEAFNDQNDAARMTWEDVFEARLFASYIIKESNVHNRRIQDYMSSPMAILLESDKIKDGIFNFEHDLWSY